MWHVEVNSAAPEQAGGDGRPAIDSSQPVANEVLEQLWDDGRIDASSLVWRAGMAEWLPLGDVPELAYLRARPRRASAATVVPSAGGMASASAAGAAGSAAAAGAASSTAWQPAAHALSSLVDSELNAKREAEQRAATAAAVAGGARPDLPLGFEAPWQRPSIDPLGGATANPLGPPPTGLTMRWKQLVERRGIRPVHVWLGILGSSVITAAAVVVALHFMLPGTDAVTGAGTAAPAGTAVAQSGAPTPVAAATGAAAAAGTSSAGAASAAGVEGAAATGSSPTTGATAAAGSAPVSSAGAGASAVAGSTAPAAGSPGGGAASSSVASTATSSSTATAASSGASTRTSSRPQQASAAAGSDEEDEESEDEEEEEEEEGEEASAGRASNPTAATPPAAGTAVKETLTKDDIIAGIKRNGSSVGPCLLEARNKGEITPGPITITLDWTIEANGSVSNARVKGPPAVLGTSMPACFTAKMSGWRFPASQRATPISNFPFGVTVR